MRRMFRYLSVLSMMLLVLAACTGADSPEGVPAAEAGSAAPAEAEAGAEVLETMDSGGYTYVRLKTDEGDIWAAGPVTSVAVGDAILVRGGTVMKDFYSKTLDRTFDSILFLSALPKAGEAGTVDMAAEAHKAAGVMPGMAGKDSPVVEAGSVPKAEGGYTVVELYERRTELAGTEVAVIGRVVKYNGGIMGRNWIHLQDGSGDAGTNDLTLTTATAAAVGDVVLARGKLVLDKDFGAGYHYELIIEDATVSRQP